MVVVAAVVIVGAVGVAVVAVVVIVGVVGVAVIAVVVIVGAVWDAMRRRGLGGRDGGGAMCSRGR